MVGNIDEMIFRHIANLHSRHTQHRWSTRWTNRSHVLYNSVRIVLYNSVGIGCKKILFIPVNDSSQRHTV